MNDKMHMKKCSESAIVRKNVKNAKCRYSTLVTRDTQEQKKAIQHMQQMSWQERLGLRIEKKRTKV